MVERRTLPLILMCAVASVLPRPAPHIWKLQNIKACLSVARQMARQVRLTLLKKASEPSVRPKRCPRQSPITEENRHQPFLHHVAGTVTFGMDREVEYCS